MFPFFNPFVFQRVFKARIEALFESRPPVGKLNSDIVSIIRDWINEDCLLTLDDISHRLVKCYGIFISQDKIACCFNQFHFSVERVPVNYSFKLDENAIILLRKVFADDLLKYSNRYKLFFLGTTKINVNTRVYQGKKAVPQWAIESKTFTIRAALCPDKVFQYEIQDSSYSIEKSPGTSPDKPESLFVHFFQKFINKLEADRIKRSFIILDGPCFQLLLKENANSLGINNQVKHKIKILPGNSSDFNPLEALFDSLRSHVEKLEPTEPENVFSALKNLPVNVTENDCSCYFSDSLKLIQIWSDMQL